MLDTWFATPVLLLTLAVVPIATAFLLYAAVRRRHALSELGGPAHLRKALLVRPRVRRLKTLALVAALFLIAVACARPQWGHDPNPPRRAGRDVVLVLDLSRSMLAEQPSRRELALRALKHVADAFEADGGNRVALVLFASRAELFFPLTQDYEHLRQALARIEVRDYPTLRNPASPSGTRIGAALQLAVESCGPARANRPVIVLLSDGDDPDDGAKEWLEGAALASANRIRVHTVGIGDPVEPHTITIGKERLLYDGKPVLTTLQEDPLREIAQHTGGVYLPARTDKKYPLGTYVRHLIDADAWADPEPITDALPTPRQRYVWFLFPALVLFMLTMLLREGPVPTGAVMSNTISTPFRRNPRAAVPAIVCAAILSISAAASPAIDKLLRQGDDAFAAEQYESALEYYEQVEALTPDPGLVAFNKAAAYFRLKRFREAVESYRRCLEDDLAPPARKARAHFDMGNALLHDAGDDANLLAQSTAAYRACLGQPGLDPKLREDARHNLEVVQQLWLKARDLQQAVSKKNGDTKPPAKEPENGTEWKPVAPKKNQRVENDPDAPQPTKSERLKSQGAPQTLRDDEKLQALSAADTAATLDRAVRRIEEQRRQQRHPDGPAAIATKDW